MKKQEHFINRAFINVMNARRCDDEQLREAFIEDAIQWVRLAMELNETEKFTNGEFLEQIASTLSKATYNHEIGVKELMSNTAEMLIGVIDEFKGQGNE